jgi:chitinase
MEICAPILGLIVRIPLILSAQLLTSFSLATAAQGECTLTSGYISNYEISQIIANPAKNAQQYSDGVGGDILVYDSTQWVSWLTPATYANRLSDITGMNFAGTSDWAIDLNSAGDGAGNSGPGSGQVLIGTEIYTQATPTVNCQPPCTFIFPPWTMSTSATISQAPTTPTVRNEWPLVITDGNGITSTSHITETVTTRYHQDLVSWLRRSSKYSHQTWFGTHLHNTHLMIR